MKHSKIQVVSALLATALWYTGVSLSATNATAVTSTTARPNILFIMVDDLGYGDLGVTGSRHIRTPNIDRLAEEGLFVRNGYANAPICSPTRVALATGRYQQRYPIGLDEPVGPHPTADGLPAGELTLASRLGELGYRSALVGKWHLGDAPEHGPRQHGYDHFFGINKGAADYFRHRVELERAVPGDGLYLNDRPVTREGYLTNLFADETIRLIQRWSGEGPFMISLHFNAPHWPWEGPFDEEVSRHLTSIKHEDGGSLATYAGMMESMDQNVGRILLALDAAGIADDTIVVFTSDNGAERFSDPWPFVGLKGEVLEGGIRVPIILRWPARIAPRSSSSQVMVSMDFVPTLLRAAGGNPVAAEFDGEDLLPVLLGETPVRERTLFWRHKSNAQAAVRRGEWKYVRIGGQEHLFNVERDQRERAELKDRHPQLFAEMRDLWEAWNAQMLTYPEASFSEDVRQSYPDRY